MAADHENLLATPVSCGGSSRPFGELTAEDARRQAEAIAPAAGFGHGSRAGAVALAWRELATALESQQATNVSGLAEEAVRAFAERLWIVPPGGSLLP